jgi:protein-S-isoprenylcysteine O-methyltransferase Ste14
MMALRHLLSIAILPFTVTVLVPWWIRPRNEKSVFEIPLSQGQGALMGLGFVVMVVGLILFVSSLQRFATDGKGTLAPWDPPRAFVASGPYRYVRNPMISGVILILLGEAAILQTRNQVAWATGFFALNALMIPLFEEPQLRARFGEPYAEYCRNVGRLIPRLTPWEPGAPTG